MIAVLIVIGLAFGISVAQSGSKSASNSVMFEPEKAIDLIDAGVVFTDQPHYVCVPLSRLGISGSSEISSIRSSCDCTLVSVIKIRESATRSPEALKIDFKQEYSTENAALIQVEFTINTTSGDSHKFAIRFVSASLLTPVVSELNDIGTRRKSHD